MDPRNTRLAALLVDYSCKVKKGERLLIEANGFEALDLVTEIVHRATRKGAFVYTRFQHDSVKRALLREATEEQIQAQRTYDLRRMKAMDCWIGIGATSNPAELADVPSQKTAWFARHYSRPVHLKVRVPQTRWVVLRYPNDAMAQAAQKSRAAMADFYYDVCTLDYARMGRAMRPLKRLMERTDQVRIKAPGTDLAFSIRDLPAIPCAGEMNIPDGEIFTAPVRGSVEGTVCFNAGSRREGTTFGKIDLTFRKGRVVEAAAGPQTKQLQAILDRDAGARSLGEFAFGVNPFVTKPLNDILFDEKIAGSFHMALGNAYDECDNGNRSSIHWDLIQIQTPRWGGGEIWFDGKLIRRNGRFLPKALHKLNPEQLKA